MTKASMIFVLSTVLLNAGGSLLVKKGAQALTQPTATTSQGVLGQILPAINLFTIAGLALLGLSFVFFILVLSKVPISVAQPMLSLSYIVVLVGAYFIYGESMGWIKILGIGVVMFGVFLLSRTA